MKNPNEYFYQDLSKSINATLGRKAVSVDQVKSVVEEARYIRSTQGVIALYAFASEIPYRFFTEDETKRLKKSSRYKEFSYKLIDLMVKEGVLTSTEAMMLKRSV